MWRPMKESERY